MIKIQIQRNPNNIIVFDGSGPVFREMSRISSSMNFSRMLRYTDTYHDQWEIRFYIDFDVIHYYMV